MNTSTSARSPHQRPCRAALTRLFVVRSFLLQVIASSCPNLTDLQIEGGLSLTDNGIVALLNGCKNLNSLCLRIWWLSDYNKPVINLTAPGLDAINKAMDYGVLKDTRIDGYIIDTSDNCFKKEQNVPQGGWIYSRKVETSKKRPRAEADDAENKPPVAAKLDGAGPS